VIREKDLSDAIAFVLKDRASAFGGEMAAAVARFALRDGGNDGSCYDSITNIAERYATEGIDQAFRALVTSTLPVGTNFTFVRADPEKHGDAPRQWVVLVDVVTHG